MPIELRNIFKFVVQKFSNVSEYLQINVQIFSKLVNFNPVPLHMISIIHNITELVDGYLLMGQSYAPIGDFFSTETFITYPHGHRFIALVSSVTSNENLVQFTCYFFFFIKIHTTLYAATPQVEPQVPIKPRRGKHRMGRKH